jgi:hypothetical protein
MKSTTESIVDMIRSRSDFGMEKYGVSMDRTDLTTEEWIQHAMEEMLDGAQYLYRIKQELAKRTLKITKVDNQYVLNINLGAITVFETAELHSGIMLVLKSKFVFFDGEGNEFSKYAGVCTLMGDPMIEALEQMQILGVKVVNIKGNCND